MNSNYLTEKKDIYFSGYKIQLLRKRIKNINLTVRTDGSVVLSVPFQLSKKDIYNFLEEKEEWIKKSKSKFKDVLKQEFKTGEQIEYLGLKYILNIIEVDKKQRIEINEDYLNIYILKKNNTEEFLEKYINSWYKSNLIDIVTNLTEIWANKLNVEVKEIRIRKLKRTWGSCNTKKNIITYSIELAKKDRSLIEYVVVHEVSHLIYDNHGKEFKQLLSKLLPDWKARKKELNNIRSFEV